MLSGAELFEWPGVVLPRSRDLRIPDLKFLSMLFWLDPMDLAIGAGRVTLRLHLEERDPI